MILGMPIWLLFGLSASVIWGLAYAIDEQLMKAGISPGFLMLCHAIVVLPLYTFVAFKLGNPAQELKLILSDAKLILLAIVAGVSLLGGNLLVLYGIADKNATLVTMIEMSYPFFVALFAWLLFKEVQITWWTALGGLFVFAGAVIIYLKGGDI